MYNKIEKLASAIYNDLVGGLRGYHANLSLSMKLLEDEIIETRLQVIKEYTLKGITPDDLYISINCIPIDCDTSLERCRCNTKLDDDCFNTKVAHFEIPLVMLNYGVPGIRYIGSVDGLNPFIYYTDLTSYRNHKYKKRGKNKPVVWIDTTPNKNGMFDCFVFNAPMLATVSIQAIVKDPRQLDNYGCCTDDNTLTFIDNEVKLRLTKLKLYYYRQLVAPVKPNDLIPTVG